MKLSSDGRGGSRIGYFQTKSSIPLTSKLENLVTNILGKLTPRRRGSNSASAVIPEVVTATATATATGTLPSPRPTVGIGARPVATDYSRYGSSSSALNLARQKRETTDRKISAASLSSAYASHASSPSSAPVPSSSNTASTDTKEKSKPLCCDKCDGKHDTNSCPYYKKPRETHIDAQKSGWKKIGGSSNLPGATLTNARVVRQPGDGSCLFHSMSYGIGGGYSAGKLRGEICAFIRNNPSIKISETPLSDWVKWDSNTSCNEYARKMSGGCWGGGIEMAVTSLMRSVNIHVYERSREGFKRISAFDYPESPETRPIVRVLYCGGVHYDALVS